MAMVSVFFSLSMVLKTKAHYGENARTERTAAQATMEHFHLTRVLLLFVLLQLATTRVYAPSLSACATTASSRVTSRTCVPCPVPRMPSSAIRAEEVRKDGSQTPSTLCPWNMTLTKSIHL